MLFISCSVPFLITSKIRRFQTLDPYLVIYCSTFPRYLWRRLPIPFLDYIQSLEYGSYLGSDNFYFRNTYLSHDWYNLVSRKLINRITPSSQLPLLLTPCLLLQFVCRKTPASSSAKGGTSIVQGWTVKEIKLFHPTTVLGSIFLQ